ncbi:MAG: DUF1887 family protein [Rhodobacteraceae bacterium]|nr:DUF1887 family protein [Paracoccaceae bacterium]
MNVVPMLHAGAGRVVGLVVLLPVANPAQPTGQDQAQAVLPAERLEAYAQRVLRLPSEHVRRIFGHPDLLGDWTGAMAQAGGMARELGAEIVFNISGGRKAATIGAILGQAGADGIPVSLITVGLDSSMRLVSIGQRGALEERALPTSARASLDDYLASYGYREINQDARLEWTAWMQRQVRAVREIKKTPWPVRHIAFRALYRRLSAAGHQAAVVEIDLSPDQYDALEPIIAALEGARLDHRRLWVETDEARRFLAGQWLEALILHEVEAILGDLPELQVLSNVEIAPADGDASRNFIAAQTEFDLVILGDDRLDLVQAKAGTDKRGLHDAITKLGAYRTRLSGPAGGAWLITPLLTRSDLDKHHLLTHARNEGVMIYNNDRAVSRLITDLKARYSRRR